MLISSFTRLDRLVPNLDNFMEDKVYYPPVFPWKKHDAILAWGCKNMDRAQALSRKHNLPIWHAEEGFLRSVGLGIFHVPPVSLLLDKSGIYYDATRPSDLETMLQNGGWMTPELLVQARRAISLIIRHDLSKFNTGLPAPEGLFEDTEAKRVLLIDQTYADKSVELGLAGPETFEQMLDDALNNNPGSRIYIKTHPNVVTGYAKGYYGLLSHPLVTVIAEDYTPLSLLKQVDEVYAVTSQMGFEALLLNKKVRCYGMPFYAGWGLTHDMRQCPRRTRKLSIEELFAAAYILYPRYLNTITGEKSDIFGAITQLATQKKYNSRSSDRLACIIGYPGRYFAKHFLGPACAEFVTFNDRKNALTWVKKHHGKLVSAPSLLKQQPEELNNVPVICMEDGFIRSSGLGAKLNLPYSLVADPVGIYYNPQQPSMLEKLLAEYDFASDTELLQRADRLREQIVSKGVSKYNLDGINKEFSFPPDKTIILVPGQVEDDMSIIMGARDVNTNLGLLKKVRLNNPGAYIIYKPHPDVENADRKGLISTDEALEHADFIADQADINTMLAHCHEVHTMTSLTGFEALLRGKKVSAYGGPFYAGWGLTIDHMEFPRRGRRLSLSELVAATLILYPIYYDWVTNQFCTPEDVLHRLANPPRGLKFFRIKMFKLYRMARKIWLQLKSRRRKWKLKK